MDITLINPPEKLRVWAGIPKAHAHGVYCFPPLGLMYIQAAVEKRSRYRAEIVDPVIDDLAWWSRDGWRPVGDRSPKPLWPISRGWRHVDPDGFWGPAVHYNWALDLYVMLLNRTAGGTGDLIQEGVYVSVNRTLDDPERWSRPLQIVKGGAWYPEVVGLEDGCGDTEAGAIGRFFMAGFSAWTMEFSPPALHGVAARPLRPTKADFVRAFGSERRCPW